MGMVPNGTTVRVQNALVTGKGTNGFFVQAKEGDAGYMGSSYSGLFIYTGPMAPVLTNAIVGTRVTIDGTVATFQGQLEITPVAAVLPETMIAEAAPAPIATTYTEIKTGGTLATALESVIVRVGGASITAVDTTFGEYTLTSGADTLVVDDFLYVTPTPTVGSTFTQVTGILALRQNASKLEPRNSADLVAGPPLLATFGPALSFTRVGSTASATIPATGALTVTLSGPAQGDTTVTITSGTPGALTIAGGGVTVPNGQTSATVQVNGLAQATDVTLTATLDAISKTAHVRVLDAAEAPTTVTLTPTTATLAPGGTQTFTATLDIPAPAGGTSVALSLAPANGGTVPATVTVAADTLAATFNFVDGSTATSTTVTATLGASTSNATVTISTGANHLVINEVDYDQIGTDNAEYIEIYNPSSSAVSLNNVAIVLINGSGSQAYPTATSTIDLSTLGSLPANGYLVIAGASITVSPPALKLDPSWTADEVQNGSPDGIALVNTSTNTLIDALSYEGSITMAQVPGIANPVSLVEGTALSSAIVDTNTAIGALCRSPNGKDSDSANADWKLCTTLTPGTANP
ncbi:MAG TPA: lamin tail domain-containing protein [Kofleriaceae bacterium]